MTTRSEYARVAHFNVTHLRRQSFYALPQDHWQLLAAPPFNYLATLDAADAAIDANAALARDIVDFSLRTFGREAVPAPYAGMARHSDIDKARSTIRQFWRDWSADGADERERSYGPVLKALSAERGWRREAAAAAGGSGAQAGEEEIMSVLVPGAGLGRLVYELCKDGFDAEGNEISYHQLLASQYILNECGRAGQHTIHPWVHTFSNHLTRAHHLRGYPIPDVHPPTVLRGTPGARPMAMCAADFLCAYGDEEHEGAYDAVASVFFLDTAPNLIRYLEVIRSCLKPGGLLVNVGPLLWHFENNAPGNHGHDDDGDGVHDANGSSGIADPGSFELTNEEVMVLLEKFGFVVEWQQTGVETPYIQDRDGLLHTTFKSSVWVARKVNKPASS